MGNHGILPTGVCLTRSRHKHVSGWNPSGGSRYSSRSLITCQRSNAVLRQTGLSSPILNQLSASSEVLSSGPSASFTSEERRQNAVLIGVIVGPLRGDDRRLYRR